MTGRLLGEATAYSHAFFLGGKGGGEKEEGQEDGRRGAGGVGEGKKNSKNCNTHKAFHFRVN